MTAHNKVLAGVKASDLQMKAFKYYDLPVGDLGLSGIVAEPTPELIKLQQELVEALAPFTVPTGTAAFYTTPKVLSIQPAVIACVAPGKLWRLCLARANAGFRHQ